MDDLAGLGCWWNCRKPMGKHIASGLSRAPNAKRCFLSSAAQGVYGRPPSMLPPASKKVATGGPLGSKGKDFGGRLQLDPASYGRETRLALTRSRSSSAVGRCSAGRRRGARASRGCARRSAAALTRAAAAATWRAAVGAHPHARKVGLPIGHPGRGGRTLHAALRVAGYGWSRGILHLRPLRRHGDGKSGHANHDEKHLLHRRTMVIRCSSEPFSWQEG